MDTYKIKNKEKSLEEKTHTTDRMMNRKKSIDKKKIISM
jgi:hypothetical protein